VETEGNTRDLVVRVRCSRGTYEIVYLDLPLLRGRGRLKVRPQH